MSSDGAKLVHAARVGDDAKVKRLLKAKVDVNYGVDGTEGCTGITALHEACVSGQAGAVRPAKRLGLIDMGLIHLFMM